MGIVEITKQFKYDSLVQQTIRNGITRRSKSDPCSKNVKIKEIHFLTAFSSYPKLNKKLKL